MKMDMEIGMPAADLTNQELVDCLYTDFLMLQSGEWEPDDESVEASIEMFKEMATRLGVNEMNDQRPDPDEERQDAMDTLMELATSLGFEVEFVGITKLEPENLMGVPDTSKTRNFKDHGGSSVFVGSSLDYDFYFWRHPGLEENFTLIARYGNEGPEYLSGAVMYGRDPVITVAGNKAMSLGLVTKTEIRRAGGNI